MNLSEFSKHFYHITDVAKKGMCHFEENSIFKAGSDGADQVCTQPFTRLAIQRGTGVGCVDAWHRLHPEASHSGCTLFLTYHMASLFNLNVQTFWFKQLLDHAVLHNCFICSFRLATQFPTQIIFTLSLFIIHSHSPDHSNWALIQNRRSLLAEVIIKHRAWFHQHIGFIKL